MKEIPIIFQPEIIRAILSGVCNLTFRVIKPQPIVAFWCGSVPQFQCTGFGKKLYSPGYDRHTLLQFCPYGQVGDRLWVRETCLIVLPRGMGEVIYRADCDYKDEELSPVKPGHVILKWRPSIHMPRWASRITLERSEPAYVKRTLDITEEEAKLCGFESDAVIVNTPAGADYTGLFALDRYMAYWDLLNKERGFPFADNVWVWGVPFGAISYRGSKGGKKNEDSSD